MDRNMIDNLVGVYGASGFGREIMPLVKAQYESLYENAEFVFVDDNADSNETNGCLVLTYEDFVLREAVSKGMILAIANSSVRELLHAKCTGDNIQMLSVSSDNSVVLDDVVVGEGLILRHFTQLTSNIRIGKHFHANIYSYVAHDCVIGDYVTFAPSVKCNGNIVIEDHAYIGTGAIIKQGNPGNPTVIGKGAVVGMGAVVTKNVPAGATVVGNPARPLVKT